MSDVPDLSSDDENFEEDDWQEMELSPKTVKCLFCPVATQSIEDTVAHCETTHNFNLSTLKLKFNMDCYSYIKLINYIRIHKSSSNDIVSAEKALWDDEKYLQPVENDDWLMYDFESVSEKQSSPKTYHANVENGLVTLSQAHFTELQRTILKLTEQLDESKTHLQMAKEDMFQMRATMSGIVHAYESGAGGDIAASNVANVPLNCDEEYFNSYAHFGIHYEMLSDKVRTESYRDAILNNRDTIQDKLVLDLGCGTGILSMFSATAGAKHVYAVDQSDIIYHAMDIIRENNLEKSITAIKGRLEDTKLENKVNIVVSEWMGYFLLFEGMLDSVIYARENYLSPGGLLLPNRCNISIVANGDVDTHKRIIDFWSDVYGYKMNCMKSEVVREASVDAVSDKHILSEPCNIKEIDLYTCDNEVMNFSSDFKLPITKDGMFTSVVGYFDTFFDLPNKVFFSTSPQSALTHWKQTVFYLPRYVEVKKGDSVEGTITCNRQKTDVRALNVQINIFGKTHKFVLS